jgi:hypothetical protein
MTFVKGQSGNPNGRPAGGKNRDTLLKEERRAIFEKEVSQLWEETIQKLKPEYVADQFMGPVTQKLEHSGEIKTTQLTPEQIEKINKIALDE